jgi:hypothetical protein
VAHGEFGAGRHQPRFGRRLDRPASTILERGPQPRFQVTTGAGVGLGVFVAQTPFARIGAMLQFGNRNRGARVPVRWGREALKANAPET